MSAKRLGAVLVCAVVCATLLGGCPNLLALQELATSFTVPPMNMVIGGNADRLVVLHMPSGIEDVNLLEVSGDPTWGNDFEIPPAQLIVIDRRTAAATTVAEIPEQYTYTFDLVVVTNGSKLAYTAVDGVHLTDLVSGEDRVVFAGDTEATWTAPRAVNDERLLVETFDGARDHFFTIDLASGAQEELELAESVRVTGDGDVLAVLVDTGRETARLEYMQWSTGETRVLREGIDAYAEVDVRAGKLYWSEYEDTPARNAETVTYFTYDPATSETRQLLSNTQHYYEDAIGREPETYVNDFGPTGYAYLETVWDSDGFLASATQTHYWQPYAGERVTLLSTVVGLESAEKCYVEPTIVGGDLVYTQPDCTLRIYDTLSGTTTTVPAIGE
jgi:hypothetical protein